MLNRILEARESKKFTSLSDFLLRVDLSKVNKKTMESLIKAGALDEFGKRSALLSTYPELVEKIGREQKDIARNQASLFGEETVVTQITGGLIDTEEFSEKEKLMFEKELARFITHNLPELEEEKEGTVLKIGGLIASVKKIITKKSNQEMAFLSIEDHAGVTVECVIFPKTFEVIKQVLVKDAIIIVEGKLQFKDERPVIIVDTIKRLTS